MLSIQNYLRAESLDQAYQLNQNRRSHVLGGMLWLRQSDITVGTAIDLCDLGLDTIEETPEEYRIGATVPLRRLEHHPGIAALTGGAVEAALKDIVGVQFRNMATVGGSIWGRFGFSDVLTVLLAADCEVELYKAGRLPLETFAAMPYDRDILTHVVLKKTPGPMAYSTVRIARTDFPVLTCAASCLQGEYKVVIGARPGKAVVVRDEQGLLKNGLTPESAKAFGDYAAETVPTGTNSRGSAEYRTHLVRGLTQRMLCRLADKEG